MLTRRRALGAILFTAAARPTWADSFPTHPVRFIVPYPPGGITDLLARKLGDKLATAWNQRVIIDNRAGAGGNLAAQIATKAEPDGYTIYMGFLGTNAANVSLYPSLGYDPVKDFTPISLVASSPMVLAVTAGLPVRTMQEFIAYAKANPGKLNIGSSGNGGASHLVLEMFKAAAGIDVVHVPYRGTSQVSIDLVAGRVQGYFDAPITAMSQLKAGNTRALAVSSDRRSAQLPDVPTMQEAGLTGFYFSTWLGVLAPSKLPAPLIATLNAAIAAATATPDFAAWCREQGLDVTPSTPEAFAQFMASETEKFGAIIKAAHITLD